MEEERGGVWMGDSHAADVSHTLHPTLSLESTVLVRECGGDQRVCQHRNGIPRLSILLDGGHFDTVILREQIDSLLTRLLTRHCESTPSIPVFFIHIYSRILE